MSALIVVACYGRKTRAGVLFGRLTERGNARIAGWKGPEDPI